MAHLQCGRFKALMIEPLHYVVLLTDRGQLIHLYNLPCISEVGIKDILLFFSIGLLPVP
jgi:hypothetical protein